MVTIFKELRIALEILRTHFAAAREIRSAFALQVVGMMINNIALVLVWIFFFEAFGEIQGWSSMEYVAMLGMSALAFGIAFTFMSGAEMLSEYVYNGTLDQFLLTPRPLYLRILSSCVRVSAIGDMFFGLILLAIYAVWSHASLLTMAMLLSSAVPAALLMSNIALATSLVSFFIPDAEFIAHNLFEVFLSPSLYPGGLFQGALRFVFVFIIPSLLVGGLPAEAAIANNGWLYLFIWAMAGAWTALTLVLLGRAVKRYESGNLTGARV
ncbi:ABC-2 family transporter protein [Candidatus Uhrbacteria bacterium]|nr:ABC-2 family transporter protein [Candidatus Uhrbacteria bacterium]